MANWDRLNHEKGNELVRLGTVWSGRRWSEMIRPVYVVAWLPAGFRAAAEGRWQIDGKWISSDAVAACNNYNEAFQLVDSNDAAAVALVALVGASDVAAPWEAVISVIELHISPPFREPGEMSPGVPGLRNLRDVVFNAAAGELGIKLAGAKAEPDGSESADDQDDDQDTSHHPL